MKIFRKCVDLEKNPFWMRKFYESDIVKTMNKIEIFNAENQRSNVSRVRFYKDKIKRLGAEEKTYFIPFKHRLLVNTRKKNDRIAKKEERHNLGLSFKKKKK